MSNIERSGSDRLLAPIQSFLDDPAVSEIMVNRPGEIWVEKNGKVEPHSVREFSVSTLETLFRLIATESQQTLNEKSPLLSASLQDGSRVQLVQPPTARFHTMSIRRKVVKNFTLNDYRAVNFYQGVKKPNIEVDSIESLNAADQELVRLYRDEAWDEFIRLCIKSRKNIVISGGTSTGKTTFLNACMREIALEDRVIILEDTREVEIPHPNQVQLLASKGGQGMAKVKMQDLLQCCLRLRPDRIIMGEIRGAEIMDFISACSTGHEGSITSVHANDTKIAFMRMIQMYKLNDVPSMTNADILSELKAVIDVVIQVGKTPAGRRATECYFRYQHLTEQVQ